MADAGELDGDSGRTVKWGEDHPNLVRVSEPWTEIRFSMFTANPALNFKSVDELKSSKLTVEYRRGVIFCETKLKPLQLEHLSDIISEGQALKKMTTGRLDLYCDLDSQVQSALALHEFEGEKLVRKVFDLGSVPLHTYLHKKHAELAPQLAATLKKMKEEGLIDTYRKQAEKELSLAR